MRRYSKPTAGTSPAHTQSPETLRVRSASRGGVTAAAYLVAGGVATLIHRTEPRGVLRARAFGWGRRTA